MTFFEPQISFTYDEIDLLLKSISLELDLGEGETSAIHLPDFGQDKKKVEALLAIREKLESGKYAGCGEETTNQERG